MTLARRSLPAIRDAEMGSASFVPHVDLDAVLPSRCRRTWRRL